ncbi:hypothetical protein MSTO_36600 [Mycobacterium stomatepiae]|uniref:Uncharacterized protein n=1 Tax=Mycobacterium stomatepiae TaxID=470076 RepID=A0A7I7QAY5_9MYCO|nr:hypothetical protein MSTO_36600 [Mycobacterium stomatepiae]
MIDTTSQIKDHPATPQRNLDIKVDLRVIPMCTSRIHDDPSWRTERRRRSVRQQYPPAHTEVGSVDRDRMVGQFHDNLVAIGLNDIQTPLRAFAATGGG